MKKTMLRTAIAACAIALAGCGGGGPTDNGSGSNGPGSNGSEDCTDCLAVIHMDSGNMNVNNTCSKRISAIGTTTGKFSLDPGESIEMPGQMISLVQCR